MPTEWRVSTSQYAIELCFVSHTSESLDARPPASLLRLEAGKGRFVQLEGAASGVERCLFEVSNTESRPGVTGPREEGRLADW